MLEAVPNNTRLAEYKKSAKAFVESYIWCYCIFYFACCTAVIAWYCLLAPMLISRSFNVRSVMNVFNMFVFITSCAARSPPQYAPAPWPWLLTFWPWSRCGSRMWPGVPCAKFRFPRPFGFRVRADVRDIRQTDGRTTDADDCLMPPPPLRGRGHNKLFPVAESVSASCHNCWSVDGA